MRKLSFPAAVLTAILLVSCAFASTYPQFSVSGYKKWSFYGTTVSPESNTLLAQTQLGGFTTSLTSGPWQERLLLKINSKLSEHLSVAYDIEQDPDTPQTANVDVKYDNTELTFGDFTSTFNINQFATTTKSLNGVMLTSTGSNYNFIFVPSTTEKSNNQALTSASGNNTSGPYSLGHGAIVEGSEQIIMTNDTTGKKTNAVLKRGVDYTMDYFDGTITFTRILNPSDTFTYTYAYTNMASLFFPTVSTMNFFGIGGSFTADRLLSEQPKPFKADAITQEASDKFPSSESTSLSSDESRGFFTLSHKGLVEFSEKVYLGGRLLKNLDDYTINYTDGTLILLAENIPSSDVPLSVEYDYYITSPGNDNISGTDSKGPYLLQNKRVIKNSEAVLVDGKKNFPDLDYTMDYEQGKITFNTKISATSLISVKYNFVTMTGTPQAQSGNSITVGATYLKESAKKGSATATSTVIEIRAGSEITNNLLNLKHFPLDSTQNVTVKVNGADFTSFHIPTTTNDKKNLPYLNDQNDPSDGYATGSLMFDTPLNATDTIEVVYTYMQSIFGTYTGTGNGGNQYIMRNVNNIVPASDTNILVRDQGSNVITSYVRNSGKTAKDGQYMINYSYPSTPTITFNDILPAGKTFQITYYYVPAGGQVQNQDVNHDVTGLKAGVNIGNTFSINSDIGISRTDQAVTTASTSDTFTGNGTRGPFTLSRQNITDGSEKVYVNGFLRNKDVDYFMNYSSGQISFYMINIQPADTVIVTYNYQSATPSTQTQMIEGSAMNLSSDYKTGSLEVSGSLNQIDPNFAPMGATSLGSGSQQRTVSVAYAPNQYIGTNSNLTETKNQIGTYEGFYNWTDDRSIGVSIDPKKILQANVSYHNYRAMDDITPDRTTHSTNSYSNSLSSSVAFNPIETSFSTFTDKMDYSNSQTVDNIANSSSTTKLFHTSNTLNVFKKANFGLDYQISEPLTVTAEGVSSHQISKDTTYNFDWDLTFPKVNKLDTRAKIINDEQDDLVASKVSATRNESISFDLNPTSSLTSSYSKSRQETLSVMMNQQNPFSENETINVNYAPISQLSLALADSDNSSLQDSGAKSGGKNSSLAVNLSPFPFFTLGGKWNSQDTLSTAISGTSEITTLLDSDSRDFTATLSPFGLANLSSEIIFEDYANANNDVVPINTKTQNITTKYGVSLSPLPYLSLSGSYTKLVTKDLLLLQEKPKVDLEGTATWRVSSWTNFVYDWQEERNHGDIEGGAVTNLDIMKVTNSYSLSVNMPQSGLILSSVVLSASYKNIIYVDNLVPANNFVASLLSFEGTINF